MTQESRSHLTLLIISLIAASLLIIVALWFLCPSIRSWITSESENQPLMHMVLQVDTSKLQHHQKEEAVNRTIEIIRERLDQFGVRKFLVEKQGADMIVVELPGLEEVDRAQSLVGQTAKLEFKLLESPEKTVFLLKKIDEVLAQAETTFFEEEEEKEPEAELVRDLFADEEEPDTTSETTSFLEEEQEPYDEGRPFTQYLESYQGRHSLLVREDDKPKVELLLSRPEVQKVIPERDEFAWSIRQEVLEYQEYWRLYLLKRRVELSGRYLVDARASLDEFRRPEVQFKLTKTGGRIFERVTGANIDKPLAIMLDGQVESAPIIRSRIRDQAVIQMGGMATMEDAVDLAILLRAGALPAPVKLIESRIIEPSSEQDSIAKGT